MKKYVLKTEEAHQVTEEFLQGFRFAAAEALLESGIINESLFREAREKLEVSGKREP